MKVGQKVVCIRQRSRVINDLGYAPLIVGEIYVVSGIIEDDIWGLFLTLYGYPHQNFHHKGFRPIDETFGEEVCELLETSLQPETIEI